MIHKTKEVWGRRARIKTKAFYKEDMGPKVGEPREVILERAMKAGQPIQGTGEGLYYAPREDGIIPGTDIRTDRMELAQEAMAKLSERQIAKRNPAKREEAGSGVNGNSERES